MRNKKIVQSVPHSIDYIVLIFVTVKTVTKAGYSVSKTKWIMKQYWRISTIRALSGLVLGMLVIGQLYFEFIPPLAELGIVGALILSFILIFFFMGLGWYYDVKAKMWIQKSQAVVERDPFQFVPGPNSYASEYPIHFAFLTTLQTILPKIGIEDSSINDIVVLLKNSVSLGFFCIIFPIAIFLDSLSFGSTFCKS